jgi:predicted RNA-binding protein YlxR (DUF448 family)
MRKMNTKCKPTGQPLKSKHIPERSCITCREKKAKKELVRVVCYQSQVEVDLTGKKPGRGAYLCGALKCWDTALRKGRLDHALHTKISPETRQTLLEFRANLPDRE